MTAITFLIPSYLRAHAGGCGELKVVCSAQTVREALGALWDSYPGLRDRVLTEQGEVRQFLNIFVGEENIRDLGGLATSVSDNCRIAIVPSVAGG